MLVVFKSASFSTGNILVMSLSQSALQEVQLSQRDPAPRCVSSDLVNCCTGLQLYEISHFKGLIGEQP